MESTKIVFQDVPLRDRYKVIEEIPHNLVIYKPRIFKCLDKWSGKIVILKLIPAIWKIDPVQALQILKGLMIASDLQRQSDKFLKINDISYYFIKELNSYGFVVNTEFIDWTLTEAFKNTTINDEEKIRIFYNIATAVREMEDAGVVHTNLNPNHILISKDLQTIKICGLVNNGMLSTEALSLQRQSPSRAYKYLNVDGNVETLFRSLELLGDLSYYGHLLPKISSAMDVWSLGAIFGYILKDGVSIFPRTGDPLYTNIFHALEKPTQDDLKILQNIPPSQAGINKVQDKNAFRDRIQSRLQRQKFTDWVPLLVKMFQYQPQNRIKLQAILNDDLFATHFGLLENSGANIGVKYKAKKMDPISIKLEMDPWSWSPREVRDAIISLLGTRRSLADEKRKDLVILACNLGNATAVPAEIWVNIFMYANTNPVMYPLRSKRRAFIS